MIEIRQLPEWHRYVGGRRFSLGPSGRPWFSIWNCPLHRWHAIGRLPFGSYR